MFSLIGGLVIVILPISFVGALVNSIRRGTYRREKEKLGIVYYIGVVPMLVIAAMVLILTWLDKPVQAIVVLLILFVWGMTFACVSEVKKRNRQ